MNKLVYQLKLLLQIFLAFLLMINIAIATTLGTATTAAHRSPLATKTAATLAMVTKIGVEIGGKGRSLMVIGAVHRPKMRNIRIVCASLILGKRVICAGDYR